MYIHGRRCTTEAALKRDSQGERRPAIAPPRDRGQPSVETAPSILLPPEDRPAWWAPPDEERPARVPLDAKSFPDLALALSAQPPPTPIRAADTRVRWNWPRWTRLVVPIVGAAALAGAGMLALTLDESLSYVSSWTLDLLRTVGTTAVVVGLAGVVLLTVRAVVLRLRAEAASTDAPLDER